jgi:hypothetical protein
MAAMLSRLGGRGYQVRDESVAYGSREDDLDSDPDSDSDLERKPSQAEGAGDSQ